MGILNDQYQACNLETYTGTLVQVELEDYENKYKE